MADVLACRIPWGVFRKRYANGRFSLVRQGAIDFASLPTGAQMHGMSQA